MSLSLLCRWVLIWWAALLGMTAPVQADQRPPMFEIAWLSDASSQLSINDVAKMDPSRFQPLTAGAFSAGFSRDTFWFRLTVKAPAGEWWLDILPPVLDDLHLFEPDPARVGAWVERRTGDMLPFSAREVPYRAFVFKVQQRDDRARTSYYLRLQTVSASMLTVRLLSPPEFIASTTLEASLMLATIAVVLIVAVLNFNNWLWLRDALSPWFIAQLLCLAGYFLTSSGFAMQYLWPDSPKLNFHINTIFAFMLISTGNGMFRRLFGLDRHQQPWLFWLFELSCWLPVLALPLALLGWQVEVLPIFLLHSIFTNIVCCFFSVGLWRRGATGSGPLLLANLLTFTGIFVSIAQVMGLIPGGVFVWQSMQFSSLASIVAVHVSLGARYRNLSQARQQAEIQARLEHDERVRQQEFMAMLTHELRTSLSVLRMSVGVQPMTPKCVTKAERAMGSMSQVIEHFIQVEKLANGKMEPNRLPCDVSTLVQTLIADSREADRIHARVTQGLTLDTDAHLLRIIISNLLDNALKYGKAGTPIDVTLDASGQALCLRVSNHIGSAGAPDPQRVFEKYYRAPQAHEITGSGLGLHITASLANLLGYSVRYLPGSERVSFELRM